MEIIVCPECDGKGFIRKETILDYIIIKCPVCEGEGEIRYVEKKDMK